MYHDQNHPGITFGRWLKDLRIERDFTKSRFVREAGLDLCEYTEVEMGVTSWLQPNHLFDIVRVLILDGAKQVELRSRYQAAIEAKPLVWGDLFTREELYPVFAVKDNGQPLTKEECEKLVDHVLKPLAQRRAKPELIRDFD